MWFDIFETHYTCMYVLSFVYFAKRHFHLPPFKCLYLVESVYKFSGVVLSYSQTLGKARRVSRISRLVRLVKAESEYLKNV